MLHVCACYITISLLGGLGVEDYQNGLMPLGSYAFSDHHEETRFMRDGAFPYLCIMLVHVI